MQKFERVAVIAKPQGAISHYVRELTDLITRTGCTPYLDENAAAHMPSDCPFESGPAEDELRPVHDLLMECQTNQSSKVGVSTPSTLCSFGLVVVYCKKTFFSGKTYLEAPKAARAHSWKPERMSFFLPG